MNLELKTKIQVTKDFLEELTNKSWQEIETLQMQLNNLDTNSISEPLHQLIENLLTSYYVFVGGLENLQEDFDSLNNTIVPPVKNPKINLQKEDKLDINLELNSFNENQAISTQTEIEDPFEYFVDFDDPIGDPISDEDLYGTN